MVPEINRLIRSAQKYLASHDEKSALSVLKKALADCSPEERVRMTQILHYIGIALYRTGYRDCALKTWMSARKFTKKGPCNYFAERFSNDYGMLKQDHPYMDDWKAFYSIHLARYFRQQGVNRFSSAVEKDVIREIILDSWYGLGEYSSIKDLSPSEKLEIFRSVKIVFPLNHASDNLGDKIIPFTQEKNRNENCYCGSGIPFHKCCGRVKTEQELNLR